MRTRILLTLLLSAAAVGSASAQTQRRPIPLGSDERLKKLVSVRWDKFTLYDALQQIGVKTGVKIVPDRALVDEPLMGSLTNIPAHALMQQIADLFHYTWGRNGGTPEAPHYILYQDAASRQEELDELNRAQARVIAALEKQLERYRRLKRMPPDELQREVERTDEEITRLMAGGFGALSSDPTIGQKILDGQAVSAVSSDIGRTMLDLLDSLGPDQWSRLREEETLTFSSRPQDGEVRMPPSLHTRMREGKPVIAFPKAIFNAIPGGAGEAIRTAEKQMQSEWSSAGDFRVNIHLNIAMGGSTMGMLRVSPEPLGLETIGPMFGISGLMIMGIPDVETPPTEDAAAREKALAADPVLGKEAVLKLPPLEKQNTPGGPFAALSSGYKVADVLPFVEKAFGVKLISDAYTRQSTARFRPPGDKPIALYKVLDLLAASVRRWERDGEVIRFRSKTWAFDKRSEIPQRYLDRWLEMQKRSGMLTLDNLAEIATALRDEQLETLMFASLERGGRDLLETTQVSANAQILRLYGRLLPQQKQRLQAGQPLPVSAMFPYQQTMLLALNRLQNRSMFGFAMGLKPTRTPGLLASGVLMLEKMDLRDGQPEQKAPPREPRLPNVGAPAGMYTFRLAFPSGQKDEYRIVLSAPAARPSDPAPPPRPVQEAPGRGR